VKLIDAGTSSVDYGNEKRRKLNFDLNFTAEKKRLTAFLLKTKREGDVGKNPYLQANGV